MSETNQAAERLRRVTLPARLPRKLKKLGKKRILSQLASQHGISVVRRRVRVRWSIEHGWTVIARPHRKKYTLISTDAVIDIPADVAVCPYCSQPLHTSFSGWEQWRGGRYWIASCFELECNSEPDIDSDEYDDWLAEHTHMPYVYWLPVQNRVARWVNSQYRFLIDGPTTASTGGER